MRHLSSKVGRGVTGTDPRSNILTTACFTLAAHTAMAFEGPAESLFEEESDTGVTHAGRAMNDEKGDNVSGELVTGGGQVVSTVNEAKDDDRLGAPLAGPGENENIMEMIGERMKTSVYGWVLPED